MNELDMKDLYKDFKSYIKKLDEYGFKKDVEVAMEHSSNSYILDEQCDV